MHVCSLCVAVSVAMRPVNAAWTSSAVILPKFFLQLLFWCSKSYISAPCELFKYGVELKMVKFKQCSAAFCYSKFDILELNGSKLLFSVLGDLYAKLKERHFISFYSSVPNMSLKFYLNLLSPSLAALVSISNNGFTSRSECSYS